MVRKQIHKHTHQKKRTKRRAANKIKDIWLRTSQNLTEYKEKWERVVKKSDERDEVTENKIVNNEIQIQNRK
jgi:hypothetical protein